MLIKIIAYLKVLNQSKSDMQKHEDIHRYTPAQRSWDK